MSVEKTPVHQWTNGGDEVLVVRFVSKDGKSYGDFQHPMKVGESVAAPDWKPDMNCGGGIHGWPWAIGLGEGKECDWTALWQVYSVNPKDIVGGDGDLKGKAKFRTGTLKFLGHWQGAADFVLKGQMAWVFHNSSGSASNSGAEGCAVALSIESVASGIKGSWLTIAEWKFKNNEWHRVDVKTVKVDGKKIKENIPYQLKNGKFIAIKEEAAQ